ncbi:DUF397 domain-containing protein [Actinomadura bangladeshensis]|uniref:DUF397 domain-containing protein n=1 Tax=Actinomadura bangladeshensis TaxID=453573 RepID=A0A4R4NEL9_9ACTN|nr:DUF397 domain-containing protein [Actinomadura bangladeshensis]TDC07399.1 DUF397 domain-containing protein [Actinomadura bangladeshensis]
MKSSKAVWRRSSYSGANGGECVEVANIPGSTVIRDSKDPDGPMLTMKRNDFRLFAEKIRNSS